MSYHRLDKQALLVVAREFLGAAKEYRKLGAERSARWSREQAALCIREYWTRTWRGKLAKQGSLFPKHLRVRGYY